LPEDGAGIPIYTNHDIDLEPGDTFYLFTDGIVDQFGGGDYRRFNRKRLAEVVAQVQHLPANQQATYIQGTIESWMGNYEQTDDMLLLAIQF
jgi:serine phosphatase RsbU (regulator of sigma subunit)